MADIHHCGALISGNYRVDDEHITASSGFGNQSRLEKLSTTAVWCSNTSDADQWLKVMFKVSEAHEERFS